MVISNDQEIRMADADMYASDEDLLCEEDGVASSTTSSSGEVANSALMPSTTATTSSSSARTNVASSVVASPSSTGGVDGSVNDANGSSSASSSSNNNANNSASSDNSAAAKRKQIQTILKNKDLSDFEKRLKIQHLMDGRACTSSSAAALSSSYSNNGTMLSSFSISASASAGNRTTVAVSGGTKAALSTSDNQILSSCSSASSTATSLMKEEAITMSCVHYERKCNIVAPCCDQIFGCRVCHDENTLTYHGPMDRFAIKEIVCKECNTRQPKSNTCINCKITFGEYYCDKCNLWMSLSKKPFHCELCGFCRVGGQSNFRHCEKCCMCISINVYNDHNCLKDKYKNNCPVCREDMFSSRQSPQDLPCGHAIHAHCFRKLAGFDYRCPICKKTAVSQESMAAAWSARARDIAMQPMPEDLIRIVSIMCNDCEKKSDNLSWHFLGVQCPKCDSFNTALDQNVITSTTPVDVDIS